MGYSIFGERDRFVYYNIIYIYIIIYIYTHSNRILTYSLQHWTSIPSKPSWPTTAERPHGSGLLSSIFPGILHVVGNVGQTFQTIGGLLQVVLGLASCKNCYSVLDCWKIPIFEVMSWIAGFPMARRLQKFCLVVLRVPKSDKALMLNNYTRPFGTSVNPTVSSNVSPSPPRLWMFFSRQNHWWLLDFGVICCRHPISEDLT